MMDKRNWSWFRIGSLFKLQKCKCSNATELLEEGDEIAYIGAKKSDNGVMQWVKKVDSLVSSGNSLVFIGDGQGSVGYCIYQPVDFIGSTTLIAGYNPHLNPYTATYLISVLDKERYRYSFGRKYKKDIIANTRIPLPAKSIEEPDWQYMEDYIKHTIVPQLPAKAQKVWKKEYDTKPAKAGGLKFDTSNWKWFELDKLFTIDRGTRLTIPDREPGSIPLVTAGETQSGVSDYINNEVATYKNALTIDMFGFSCYREYEFACDDNILVLHNTHINRYNGLFIATIINEDRYRCAYGRQYRQKTFKKHIIKLPATPSGEPDWQFMEDYIKSLPYSKNLEPTDPQEQIRILQRRLALAESRSQTQSGNNIINYGNIIINDNSTTLK